MAALVMEVREFPITTLLSAIYVGLFVAMALVQGSLDWNSGPLGLGSLSIKTLVDFGAIEKDRILLHHEYWRLITATMLHGSIIHLLLNTLALRQLGRMIEDWHGGGVLVLLHLLLGLAGSLASLWVHRMVPGRLVQVGGSGAIFGLASFLMVASYFDDHEQSPALCRNLFWSLLIGFGLGSLLGADDAAHLGGALAGAVVGTLDDFLRPNALPRWVARSLGIASLALIAGAYTMQIRELAADRERELEKRMQSANQERQRLNLTFRIRAGAEMALMWDYAEKALAVDRPPAIPNRAERADFLDYLANQMGEDDTAKRLRTLAELLRVEADYKFLARAHLEKILATKPRFVIPEEAPPLTVP